MGAPMLLHLTDLSQESLQAQLIRQVRAKILAGELPAEANLPSIRALARDQHVSVITVQRAYESLEREGLIYSRRGKGFFVADLAQPEKKSLARQRLRENVQPVLQAALDEGLPANEVLTQVEAVLDDLAQDGEGQ